jgi:hypothetical protein
MLTMFMTSLTPAQAIAKIPQLGIEKTCRAAQPLFGQDNADKTAGGGNLGNAGDQKPYQNCMQSENAARKSSADLWSKVSAADQEVCVGLSRMVYPSYVELMSCLQLYDRTVVLDSSTN